MNDEWALYDYVDRRDTNTILEWMQSLEVPDRAKLKAKIHMLRRNGPDLPTLLLSDTSVADIKKIRVNGRVALRPLLCPGPIRMDREFTFLLGAFERDSKWVPAGAPERAAALGSEVAQEPFKRRTNHGQHPRRTAG